MLGSVVPYQDTQGLAALTWASWSTGAVGDELVHA